MADNPAFRQSIYLLYTGVPYECIFGKPKQWPRLWRDAATLVVNEIRNPEEEASE